MIRICVTVPVMILVGYLANPGELIQKELDESKTFLSQDLEEANKTLIRQMEETIKQVAKQGNLDLVLKLGNEKKEFELEKKLPKSVEFKSYAVQFNSSTKKANDNYKKVLEKNIKEYTKILEVDKAFVLKLELDSLISPPKSLKESKSNPPKKQSFSVYGLKALRFANSGVDANYFYNRPEKDRITLLRPKGERSTQEKQFHFVVVPGLADKKGVSFGSPFDKNHFLVLIEDTVWRLQMEPLRNNQSHFDRATFLLRKTEDSGKFLVESYARGKQFLVPGSPSMVRFKRDDGTDSFRNIATVTIENLQGAK